MCAIKKATTYTVTTDDTELYRGCRFTVTRRPITRGNLCLIEINGHLVVGRWFGDLVGCDWVLQWRRWIRISRADRVRIIGAIDAKDLVSA